MKNASKPAAERSKGSRTADKDAGAQQPDPAPAPAPPVAQQSANGSGATGSSTGSTSTVSPLEVYMREEAPYVLVALTSMATRLGEEGNYLEMNQYMDRATILRDLSGWKKDSVSSSTIPASMVAGAGR
jgi:hypothetical protein